jgi:hypothetical protein
MRKLVLIVLAAACGPTMATDVCREYVACARKLGGSAATAVEQSYGENGGCYVGGARDACNDACRVALDSVKQAYPDAGC